MLFSSAFVVALLAALAGGFVRGFTGFGGALIFIPVASAAFGPQVAAPLFLLMDYSLTLPLVFRSARVCNWPTVLPAAIGGLATVPLGAWLLANGDPVTLRWTICLLVMALLVLIVSGWRYRQAPHAAASVAVGGVAGVFGGIGQVSGPPVAAFWMSGPFPVSVIRANLIVYFAIISLSSVLAYFWNDLFSRDGLILALVLGPLYAASLYFGTRNFTRTEGANYRPIVYGLIAFAAVSSMPAFDSLLR